MCNQQRLARSKGQNKALVTAAIVVIGKQLCDRSFACDLASALLFGECVAQLAALRRCHLNLRGRRAGEPAQGTGLAQTEVEGHDCCTCE